MPDDFDPVVADRCSALDDVPVPADLWSRVQFKVLDRLPVQFTEEEATMIDLQTQSHTDERQKRTKRVLVSGLLAAAAVIAIALVATRGDDAVNPADEQSPTVTVPPTTPPRSLLGTLDKQLVPGTYYIDHIDGTPTPRIYVTVGEGWGKDYSEGLIIGKTGDDGTMDGGDGDGFMMISQPTAVFLDACNPADLSYHPGPVTTFDGLVAALSEQKGWVDVTAPTDISIDGYAGKAFQRTVPTDMSHCDTFQHSPPNNRTGSPPYPVFVSWVRDTGLFSGGGPYEPGQIETVWILDLDGTVVLINTRPYPEASAAAHAEFAAVLDSIRIERA